MLNKKHEKNNPISIKKYVSILLITNLLLIFTGCAASKDNGSGYYGYSNQLADTQDSLYIKGNADSNDPFSEDDFHTEEYNAIKENPFEAVKTNPLSTFAADVDTASYSNIRRMINSGKKPEADAVRIEEMINYFKYDYPQPQNNEPFSVTTEISDCPWNSDTKLLLIGLQAKNIDLNNTPPSNLVFLIDVSGSMTSYNKLPLVKQAFKLLTEQLKENDRVSIVTYAGTDTVVLNGASGDNKDDILEAIEYLSAGGSTAGSKGIETAYKIAEQNFIAGGNNRIILATDGDLNVGITSEGALKRLVSEKKKNGVYLSVLGFGTGNIKDNKMEALADNGNGNYSYIDSVAEARKVLVSEIGGTCFTVAKDVKLQVEFNPAFLKGYRLIGYENRIMNSQDFNDDTKDGGEIGAGHRVTAIYEIVPLDSPMSLEIDLKYQDDKNASSNTNEWLTLKIRYKEPDSNKSTCLEYPVTEEAISQQMSQNLCFAAGVAEVGMLLRNSQYSGTSSYDSAYTLISSCNDIDNDECKNELLTLIKKLKSY